ncbi:MAG: RNA polymerase sigma-70 factor [Prolixibacteraceae bacterium]|jgi:RNA polymerase sigma-70 factor (ECF subfamily)|nr:RNA polymerase sigma-70 factor [Prolixibacteraceae bacterium]
MQHSVFDISSSDNVLLEEIRNGNTKAFDLIFRKYYDNLCRFAYCLVHDADMSQSLVQNVFVRLWERRLMTADIGDPGAYLTTMVRNQCSDYLKEQKKRGSSLPADTYEKADYSTEQEIDRNNFEEKLVVALSKLPPRCRMAFEYSRFENMTNKEIASEMNISVKGVEALIGRSLKSLRDELKEFLPSFNANSINPVLFWIALNSCGRKTFHL